MIQSLIKGIFDLVIFLVNVLLTPIDLVISSLLPDFSGFAVVLGQFFTYILQFIGYILDMLFIPRDVISLVCAYLIFKVTVSLFVYPVKLAIKWYNSLKT